MYNEMNSPNIHVGLDIGTTKVCVVVASVDGATGRVDIIGTGIAPCDGLKRGVVTNIGKTADAIKIALEKAEQQSGYQIGRVVVGISGDHVKTTTTRAIVSTSSAEVNDKDINRLHHELRQVRITPDRRILHVIPQDYIIDGQDGVSDPHGMSGKRLEAIALVITAGESAVENIYKCCERAGVDVDAVVLQPLASALAVLEDVEREVGVALIDIGGGTTDIAIFKDNVLRSSSIVAIAGQKVTDDITAVLGIRSIDAEKIKVEQGHAASESIHRDDYFQIPGVAGRSPQELSKSVLCQIIEPRVEETFEHAIERVVKSGYSHHLSAGVVITGGGALLKGTDTLAQRLFRMQVTIGNPRGFSSDALAREVSTPLYATAVGLALYSMKHAKDFEEPLEKLEKQSTSQTVEPISEEPVKRKGLFGNVIQWFENL